MPRDMWLVYPDAMPMPFERRAVGVAVGYIYAYRRGVCVARFYDLGNAKASKGETSNRYRFSRFSYFIKV